MSTGIILLTIVLTLIRVSSVYGKTYHVCSTENSLNNVSCITLANALTNLTSGGFVFITSTPVSLLTMVKLDNLNNITIRGHGNTKASCNV